jgi:SPP1 family phage portal protein
MIQLNIDRTRLDDEEYVRTLINAIMLQKLIEGVDKKYSEAFDYYDGKKPITSFDSKSKYECKVVNLTKPIVDIATKTFIGELPDIVTSGEKEEKDKISVFTQKLYNAQFGTHIYETLRYSSKCGTGYLAVYNDNGDTFPRFRELNPRFTECVYDCNLSKEHLLSYFIIQVNDATNPTNLALSKYVVYVFTKNMCFAYESPTTYTAQTTVPDATKDIIIKPYFAWTLTDGAKVNNIRHDYGDIPIVEFPNNAEYKGDAECVFDLIKLYNEVINNRCKNLYDVVNYILLLKNVRLGDKDQTNEAIRLLEENHVLPVVGDDVDAKFLTNPLDQAQLQKLADNIKDLIHSISRVPDLSSTDFSQNASDPIIKIKTKPLLDLCNDKEKLCTEPYRRVLGMVLNWCKKNSSDYSQFNFDLGITKLSYTHTLPSNDNDMITMITNLANSGMANPEVLLQNISFIDSVHDYIKGMNKWNKQVDKRKSLQQNNEKGLNPTNLERQNKEPLTKDNMDNKSNFNEGNAKTLSDLK